ncbi:RNA polymerase II subunit 5-mediating protein-like protein [Diplonema papillatum]|nr:RNA polymerase II subunit 5-mediating protein-like protein [Diplonema papillatum]
MDAEVATWDEERARQLGIDYDPSQHWLERTDKVREALRKKRANKASYLQLSKKLQGMLETPRHTTMVPAGKLAFLEATVVHTNDILAFLGDAYFAERSVAQCKAMIDRRILYIDQDLDRLTSESEHCTQRLGLLDFFSGIGAGGNGPKPRQPGDSATWASPAGNLVASDRLGPTDTAVPTKEGPEASGRLKNTSPVAEKLLEVDRSNIKETLARIAEMEARGQRVGLLGGESAPDSDDNLRPLTEAELHERLVASEATSRIIESDSVRPSLQFGATGATDAGSQRNAPMGGEGVPVKLNRPIQQQAAAPSRGTTASARVSLLSGQGTAGQNVCKAAENDEVMEEDDEEEEEEEEEDEEEGSTGLDKAAVGYRMRLAGITDGGDGVVPSYKGSLLSKLDNMLNPGVEQPLYANPADIFKAWDAPSSSQQQHPIPCQAPKNQMEDNAVRAEVSVSKEPDGKMREAPSATPGVVKDTVVLKGDSSACLPPPPPRERKPRLRSYA